MSTSPSSDRADQAAESARACVARLRGRYEAVLRGLVPEGARVALLEFPHYPNPGDSAIWLGERACLARMGIPTPVYTADLRTWDAAEMRAVLRGERGDAPPGETTILLQGGGSFGDVWPMFQEFREQVIQAFPDHPIVQLPQSIHFQHEETLERARRVIGGHPRFTLLVRDEPSLKLARGTLGAAAQLCPDAAFCLEPGRDLPAPRAAPAHPIAWIRRTDAEARDGEPPPDAVASREVDVVDWPGDRHTWALRSMRRRSRRLRRRARPTPALRGALSATYDSVARQRLGRALRLVDAGRVVVTDRLHGHIFCLLRGRPHVLLDNAYGKLVRFRHAWTRDTIGVRQVRTPEEALEAARALGGEAPGA